MLHTCRFGGYLEVTLTSIAKAKAFQIIQTSKTRYQAWFYCPASKDWETYEKVAKYLATKFDGDMGASHKKQVGRLPGYKNHKRNGFKTRIHHSSLTPPPQCLLLLRVLSIGLQGSLGSGSLLIISGGLGLISLGGRIIIPIVALEIG